MQERGADLVMGRENTFERTCTGVRVASRIDFAVVGGGAHLGPLKSEWGLSDHLAIGGVVQVGLLTGVIGVREAIDWDAVSLTFADENEDWYGSLVGDSAYERLVDFRRRQLKRIRICGRSKRWWDSDLSRQVRAVRRARRQWVSCGNRNVFRAEVSRMKRLVREKKDQCWRAFCEESGLQSPWEMVRWARDPWRVSDRMRRLRGSNGVWLDGDGEKVGGLVRDVFGLPAVDPAPWIGEGLGVDFPYSRVDVRRWVLAALGRTKNGSAPRPDGISYRLIKAVRDSRLGWELVDEVVDCLVCGVIPSAWREMRVVFISKPGRDLTLTKSWRPLNLINCMGKLGEKVVADRIQDCGKDLFHHLQFGSVRGRSAVDVFYRSVVRARRCLDSGGGGLGLLGRQGGLPECRWE